MVRLAMVAVAMVAVAMVASGCTATSGAPPPTGSTGGSAATPDPSGAGSPRTSTGAEAAASAGASAPERPGPTPGMGGPGRKSGGWTVTVYYTAVERYHSGPPTRVRGCPSIDCAHGADDLGSYPADFVSAVRDEGTGRTSAGRYLNWSSDTGYWLDDAPRDTAGRALRPFESAAADANVLREGSRFSVVACGREEGGGTVDAAVCAKVRDARWIITDEFTPGMGGPKHVDVYIGEETGPGFTAGSWYTTLVGASLTVS